MTINELITKAHSAAKAKGFWDQERNTGELLMLIVSECGEALEAHRKGRIAKNRDLLNSFNVAERMMANGLVTIVRGKPRQPGSVTTEETMDFKELFEFLLKDTFEDELADIVIRIADLCGGYGLEINEEPFDDIWNERLIPEQLFLLVGYLYNARMGDGEIGSFNLGGAVSLCFFIAETHGIDLWRHIELKLAYNETRPRLHGKNY